jgi:type VI secretion system secreted protein Hcp
MSGDIFLKLNGIEGESKDQKHPNEIQLETVSWGASNSTSFNYGGGGGTGKVTMQDLHFTKVIDKASSKLFYHCCSGKHFPDATLTFRKAGGEQEEYFQVKMTDLMVSSITWSDHAGGGSLAQEQGSLSFTKIEFIYKMQGQDGKLQGQVRADWNVKENKGST